jgi:hypothetical protein
MTNDIKPILKRLNIEDTGHYDNHFYVIPLTDSNEYAKTYTKLDNAAINTEYPSYEFNSSKTLIKETHYFELEESNVIYNIFLIADYGKYIYYVKIGEKPSAK